MSYTITKEHVWVGVIDDRPGALCEKLQALSDGGVNLELIITRRDRADRAVLFVSPIQTREAVEVAGGAGLSIAESMHNIRIAGPNVVGIGARITGALARAGINLRGYSAAALGELHVTNLAVDTLGDLEQALEVLGQELES